jgi:hypothetical protein
MPSRKGRPARLQIPEAPLPSEPLQKSAFARLIGCAPARITEFVSRGILRSPAITPAGLVVPALAVAQLVAAGSMLPRAGVPAPRPALTETAATPPTYDQARAEHEALKVQMAELKLAERRGELVPKALADHVLFDCTRALRDSWIGWPPRVAAVMAAKLKVDPALLLAELDRAVKAHLAAVADPKADWRARSAASYGGAT